MLLNAKKTYLEIKSKAKKRRKEKKKKESDWLAKNKSKTVQMQALLWFWPCTFQRSYILWVVEQIHMFQGIGWTHEGNKALLNLERTNASV